MFFPSGILLRKNRRNNENTLLQSNLIQNNYQQF